MYGVVSESWFEVWCGPKGFFLPTGDNYCSKNVDRNVLRTDFDDLCCDVIDLVFFCKQLEHELLLSKCDNRIKKKWTEKSKFTLLCLFNHFACKSRFVSFLSWVWVFVRLYFHFCGFSVLASFSLVAFGSWLHFRCINLVLDHNEII